MYSAMTLDDGLAGIEAGIGVLEDDLEVLPELPQLPAAQLHDVAAVVEDLAGGGLDEPDDGAAQGGLAAAGLAHDAHGLLGVDLEVDAVHGVEPGAALELEVLLEVVDLDQGSPGVDGAHGLLPVKVAEDGVGPVGRPFRMLQPADVHAMRAALLEGAALGQGRGVGHQARDGREAGGPRGEVRDGAEEPFRIGMVPLAEEDVLHGARFHDLARHT